ncbi:alanine--tRNA ligase [uncultured Gemmiger sp.]|jgi:alanyl-tRNA synthetase|uniref:alanine--tRNA ligase n=1 Tax=uncultured Gemmiger sp. TaxID=1623490 RepID=UPI0025FC6F14|nr:alanine--tRNA ligase [uncultured Gemmiger sp.]
MQWTGLNELREKYLHFFEGKGHLRLGSFPLVPKDDPSLLLINSGMAPMKKWFLGQEEPPRHRVTTCQKCIRTPDIERVGITARHGCFFEMLGNFSFQDYFKKEVIPWAWEFLTKELEIPADRLYISVYQDDDEAYDIWTKSVGIPEDHMVRLGKEDNFWEHGSGPCGPCSEIYFDRGLKYGCGKPTCGVGCDCDRFMEIWNLVFSQYDSDGKGTYALLPKPNIDTGMGLERLAVVMQDVDNLFEVDTVAAVLHHVERISGKQYGANEKDDISIRVITDHIRATVFMASDGILPSNEGRGYVMRRLLRRAARHGRMLGIDHPFLTDLVDTVIVSSEVGYPELREHESYIKKVIGTEEERFYKTIDSGMNILNGMIQHLHETNKKILSGLDVFKLNDTFGFPLDLTKEIAAEAGLGIDEAAFHVEMTRQRERARAERLAKDISGWSEDLFGELNAEPTEFDGYDVLKETAKVLALSDGEELNDAVSTDYEERENVLVVLDRTPFYAEMGGQVADHGYLTSGTANLKVNQVKKTPKGFYVHTCTLLDGTIRVGDTVTAAVDEQRRASICRNHTATHLMQKALREVLGEHVHQAGSYQDDKITRFDFTHFNAVTPEELVEVEKRVNEKIFASLPVTIQNLPIEEAKKMGAMALFGEKYGKVVRVVDAGGWSVEFCGGTHVKNTAQIGCFKILSEASVAAGIRRIEATTGYGVLNLLDDRTAELANTAVALKANNMKDVAARAQAVTAELKEANKQLEIAKAKLASSQIDGLFQNAVEVDGVRIVTVYLNGTTPDTLRSMMDKLRDKEPNAVGALIGTDGSKTTLAVGVGKNALARGLKAGALVKQIAAIAGGNGGGKPDFAMAGIRDTSKIDDALNAVEGIVKENLEKAN